MTLPFPKISLALKNLFYPAFCKVCGRRILTEENLYFCPSCWSTIEPVPWPYCPQCGCPQKGRVGFEAPEHIHCKNCKERRPYFSYTFAAGLYDGALKKAIHLFKYHKKQLLLEPLGDFLLHYCQKRGSFDRYQAMTFVPLHPMRQRERGFNQAELLTSFLGEGGSFPPLMNCLIRARHTPYQSLLMGPERLANIKGAFDLRVSKEEVKGKAILLVDDVVTTGATVNECSKVLIKKGAARVDVLTLAVAPKKSDL